MSLDPILSYVGGFGRYQAVITGVVGINAMLSALVNVGIVFIVPSVNHWCLVPDLAKFNLTQEQYKEIVAPKDEQCKRYDLNFTDMTDLDFTTWNETVDRLKPGLMNCDNGWMFDRSMFSYTATEQYSLVCDSSYMISIAASIFMAGLLCGGVLFGLLADRFGRRTIFILNVSMSTFIVLASAFAVNFTMFVVMRFLRGFVDIGAYTAGFVLSTEVFTTEHRMYAGAFVESSFSIGICVLPAMAWFFGSHVWLQLLWALMHVPLVVIAVLVLPESPRWLIDNGRMKEACSIIKRIASWNRRPLPDQATTERLMAFKGPKDKNDAASSLHGASIVDLVRTPRMRLRSLNIFYNWVVIVMVYYGLMYGVGSFGDDLYLNTFLVAVVEIPAYVTMLYGLNKVGRRCLLGGNILLSSVCSFIMIGLIEKKGPALVVFAMIGKFAISLSFAVIYLFTTEIYPTNIRNMGLGTGSACARIGGLLAPQIGELRRFWLPLPLTVFAAVAAVGGVLCFLLPETTGRELAHTAEEVENYALHDKFTLNCFEAVRRAKSDNKTQQEAPDSDGYGHETQDVLISDNSHKIQDTLSEDSTFGPNGHNHRTIV